MQNRKKLPVGMSDFEQIRLNDYYYVDKSGMIEELLTDEAAAVTLITRPRRFGKTLGMSMLASYFDIRRDSKKLFENLAINRNQELCNQWMNQYPVIFVSFKDVDGRSFESAYDMLASTIADLYKEHLYLLESDCMNEYDKEIIRRLIENKATVTELKKSLLLLTESLQSYYKRTVILLLDEYDVPVAKASMHGYYNEMLEIIKALMSTALKDNRSLKFAVLTGCLKIAKESIFTGTNNFVSDTIVSSHLDEYFGFTEKDVAMLLDITGNNSRSESMKTWYDGYRFGDFDVYCPWDVMNYLKDLQRNPMTEPASYWKNTSDNAIIRSFIEYAGSSITGKMEVLMSGGYIIQRIEENLTYDYLHSSEENLWSILYLTGYLTRAGRDEVDEKIPVNMTPLKIPNAEIREIFETTVQEWFTDHARMCNRKELFDAAWNGDCPRLTDEMNQLLRATISYHDYKEDFYHAFLAGIFAGAGYMVESNKEHGEGRSDVVISDPRAGRVVIFEAKYSRSLDGMEQDCKKALDQMDERMYAREYEDNYNQVICYGIAFYKKRCLVKKKDEVA